MSCDFKRELLSKRDCSDGFFVLTYLLLVESHLLLLMIRHLVACSVIAGREVLLLLAIDRERNRAADRCVCEV